MSVRYFIAVEATNFGKTGFAPAFDLPNVTSEPEARAALKRLKAEQKRANRKGEARYVKELRAAGHDVTSWPDADMREFVLLAEITED